MKWLSMLALLGLAGCASQSGFDTAFPKLVGQPIDVAVATLGPADDQQPGTAGQTTYIWRAREAPVPGFTQPAYTTSTSASGSPTSIDTTVYRSQSAPSCTVSMAVDAQKIIRSVQHNGRDGGCAGYAERLKAWS